MGDYTKTGKKVMCINNNRIDLTYKKVYDVFTTQIVWISSLMTQVLGVMKA